MVNITQNEFAEIFGDRLHGLSLLCQSELSVDVLVAFLTLEHLLKIVEVDGFVSGRGQKPKPIWRK